MAVSSMKYCRGCIYKGYASNMPICQYILATHRCRPCPAGEGCTVKTTAKGGPSTMKIKSWDEIRARQLYEEGKSDLDIADMVGATVGAITAWRHKNHLKSKNPPARKPPKNTSPATSAVSLDSESTDTPQTLKMPEISGPVELSFSIAGCACSLSAPDIPSASWTAKRLCRMVENFAARETS